MGKLVDHASGRRSRSCAPGRYRHGSSREILLFRDTALRIRWSRNWSFLTRYTRLVANGGNAAFAGKGIAAGHLIAGRHLYKKVFCAVLFEGLEQFEIIGKNDEPFALFSECPDQVKVLVAVAGRDDPGEVGISLRVFDQQDRPRCPSARSSLPTMGSMPISLAVWTKKTSP